MPERPWYQQLAIALVAVAAGYLFLGAVLDSVTNATNLISRRLTYYGSAAVLVTAATAHLAMRRRPLRWIARGGREVRLSGLGRSSLLAVVGAILLLWTPRFLDTKERIAEGPAVGDKSPEKAAEGKNKEREAERHWEYLEAHDILRLTVSLFTKDSAPASRFIALLKQVHFWIHADENRPLVLGDVLFLPQLRGQPFRDHGRMNPFGNRAVAWLWMLYEPQRGYWWKATGHVWTATTAAAGLDAEIPWKAASFGKMKSLRDLASVPHFGFSLPSEMVRLGVEEVSLQFRTATWSFDLDFSAHGLQGLSWMEQEQATQLPLESRLPLGVSMSGQQALDVLRDEFLRRRLGNEQPRPYRGIMGLTGPEGRSAQFFPTMPKGFDDSQYSFVVTLPSRPQ